MECILPEVMMRDLRRMVAETDHPREKAADVMYALQAHYGYLTDDALEFAARLVGMSPLEMEELATFYDFIYRRPVGKYVIHVCDGVVCWMFHEDTIFAYLCRTLGIGPGETTPDGLFTVLPSTCIGDCHKAPSMLVNGRFYGPLTPERIDQVLAELRAGQESIVPCR